MKRRKFYKGILTHCYQRSADDGVLFYTYSDHLVYFTHYCILARKYGVRVLSMCQMPDHIHDSVTADRKENLANFKRQVNTDCSRCWNERFRSKGAVLRARYGSAPKLDAKKGRSNLVYVGNNPVERKLVKKAEDYRWNFLAYARSDHPFSDQLTIRNARWPLRKAVREVKWQFRAGKPLNHVQLQKLFQPLDRKESLQLTDFIITTYNCIDYDAAIRFFDSYEDMLTAMHATTGSEHDIKEVFVGKSDALYLQMVTFLLKNRYLDDIHDIVSLTLDRKYDLFCKLRPITDAPGEQIAKFLHMPLKKEKKGRTKPLPEESAREMEITE